ncbi:MAG: hypothetical protein N3F07_03515 [Candidatus Micrarchaeota archaeon]|nr:hypothetical protein [Candidatus Micrarchaeota archaeon]
MAQLRHAYRHIYAPEFKQIVRETPGLMKKFVEAYKNQVEEYDDGKVRITRFGAGGTGRRGLKMKNGYVHYRAWVVETEDRRLFVKETIREKRWEDFHFTGVLQYRMMQKAEKFLRFLSIFWKNNLEVLKPLFAANYWDTSFLVMDFVHLPQASCAKIPEKLSGQLKKFVWLANLFARAYDIDESNAFYDEKNGKLIIYDIGRDLHSFPIRLAIHAAHGIRNICRKVLCRRKVELQGGCEKTEE